MSSHPFVHELFVSKLSARRIPGEKCNIIRDTHAWDETRGLCDDEFSIFLMPQAVSTRERLCAQIEPIPTSECGLLYLDGAGRFLCWIGFEKVI